MKFKSILSIAFTACFTLFISACSEPAIEETPPLFSGTIQNAEVDTIYLYNNEVEIKLAVDSGRFSDTLPIEEGYYTLEIGRESTSMYWDPSFQIEMAINVDEFDESIVYSGMGAAENNALAKAYLIEEEITGQGKDFYSQSEDQFLQSITSLKDKTIGLVEGPHGSKVFQAEQKKNAEYDFNRYVYSYVDAYSYYTENDSFTVSESFYQNLIPFEKNEEATYERSPSYQNLLNSYVQFKSDELNDAGKNDLEALKEISKEFTSAKIKDQLLNRYSRYLLKPNDDLEAGYDFLKAEVSDTALKSQYEKVYTIQSKLLKGMASPTFEKYENHSGDSTSLADLKGKYVYFDIWATWCGPCIREIPALKEVEKKYHKANIQFVSISVDDLADHQVWVEMVTEKELSGLQLFANNSWSSEFIRAYNINSIPRFILVDPQGNIINADAPRPSNPELVEILSSLNL